MPQSKSGGEPRTSGISQIEQDRAKLEAADLGHEADSLASGLTFVDLTQKLSPLVSANGLRDHPIHRWYYYKEGFSPELPPYIIQKLGAGSAQTVVDTFAGVGTTALSLLTHPSVQRVIGVEYSPFASFVANTKLRAGRLDSDRLSKYVRNLSKSANLDVSDVPALAAFHNAEIFDPEVLHQLLTLRDRIRFDSELAEDEQMFLLLGIAAVTEDVSGAMKDGRALRILRGRQRRKQGLVPSTGALDAEDTRAAVMNQWLAMIEDIAGLDGKRYFAKAEQVKGDARSLETLTHDSGQLLIPSESVSVFIYSPPYLNCLDYTEVYKIELWLLGLVTDHVQFRRLREGTLRSHPSIEFPERPAMTRPTADVFQLVDKFTKFLTNNSTRPSTGKMHGGYFTDMHDVLVQQFSALEPGGAIACVVANSTFSRREKDVGGTASELWRLSVQTDVVIARIAEAVGFEKVEIWIARKLRAKNVNDGFARESIVIARKPAFP